MAGNSIAVDSPQSQSVGWDCNHRKGKWMMPQEAEGVLLFRINTLEQQLKLVQDQLKSYVPLRENELQLQGIQGTVSRIEHDVIDMKLRVEAQEKQTREREEEQRESQSALQIKVLWGIVSLVLVMGGSIFTGYITHFFH